MDTPTSFVSTRGGTPGLDIFKIAGQSISGFLKSFKTGSVSLVRQPFTTQLEERLAMYLEYHPHVRSYLGRCETTALSRAPLRTGAATGQDAELQAGEEFSERD